MNLPNFIGDLYRDQRSATRWLRRRPGFTSVIVLTLAFRVPDRLVFPGTYADAAFLIAASTVILLVAFASSYLPARRAARVDPAAAFNSSN
jgi:ABC-type antimicrobial peptide transport system permease subunit